MNNDNKWGVDVIDRLYSKYNYQKTTRWPIIMFHSISNVSIINSSVINNVNDSATNVVRRKCIDGIGYEVDRTQFEGAATNYFINKTVIVSAHSGFL